MIGLGILKRLMGGGEDDAEGEENQEETSPDSAPETPSSQMEPQPGIPKQPRMPEAPVQGRSPRNPARQNPTINNRVGVAYPQGQHRGPGQQPGQRAVPLYPRGPQTGIPGQMGMPGAGFQPQQPRNPMQPRRPAPLYNRQGPVPERRAPTNVALDPWGNPLPIHGGQRRQPRPITPNQAPHGQPHRQQVPFGAAAQRRRTPQERPWF